MRLKTKITYVEQKATRNFVNTQSELNFQPMPHFQWINHDDVITWKHVPRYWLFVRGVHPAQWPVMRSFDVFFDLRLNKRLSKQSRRWWFETTSPSLWRHCDDSERYQSIHTTILITTKHKPCVYFCYALCFMQSKWNSKITNMSIPYTFLNIELIS